MRAACLETADLCRRSRSAGARCWGGEQLGGGGHLAPTPALITQSKRRQEPSHDDDGDEDDDSYSYGTLPAGQVRC